MGEINFGQYAFPFILAIFLAFIFKQFELPDGGSSLSAICKTRIAVIVGVILAFGAMFYLHPLNVITYKTVVDYALYGFVNGGAAIGMWEMYSRQKER